ncbi:MAG: biopolymer transporter ExbD [Candidatus Eisenbacteria bacterium]
MGAVDTPERSSGKKKGGLSGRRPKRRVGIRMDMTPMVDVAFLLLIFFMVTTVFRTPKALEINLPPKDAKVDVKESNTMSIRILKDGRLYWQRGGKSFPWNRSSVGQLHDVLTPFAGQSELIMIVKVDREAEFENMVNALDELHGAKLTRFSINPLEDKEKQEVEAL